MAELLLEIGLEEIPARMIAAAEQELARRVSELITRERLTDGELVCRSYSTPRRLAVHLSGVVASQADAEELLVGPAWNVAFKEGAAGPAAHAFAKKAGVGVDALVRMTTPKGDYVSASILRRGRPAAELLSVELPKEIGALAWPKNMYWRRGKPERYVRPVRWLMALLDHAILPVEFAGVHAANLTYGHRVLHGAHAITISDPAEYVSALEAAHVLVYPATRRHRIRKALDHATRAIPGARWREDPELEETVVHLTEWPSVVLGSFEPGFLALPEEVLVTVMRDHQKYFAVEDAEGQLAAHFLAVLNTEPGIGGVIRHGNERVLRARFSDAQFFWKFDQKTPLADRTELLKSVTFQKDLGNYDVKTQRIRLAAERLAAVAESRSVTLDRQALDKAALLAKVDLTTELVKEFTELQGIVGGLYARHEGEPHAVSTAMYWQYQPASSRDPIPPGVEGQLLGIADRMTTIEDMFAIGFAPTGSKDPYALRRAANAVVRILAESRLPLTLSEVISAASAGDESADYTEQLRNFFRERLEFYLRDGLGISFDVVNAVLAGGMDDIADVVARAQALTAVRDSNDFASIAAAFKRSKNILHHAAEKRQLPASVRVQVSLLADPAEEALFDAATRLGPRVEQLRQERNYAAALEQIATLRPHVDQFFDRVMVLVDDEALRANRLSLLCLIVGEFSKLADFSEIVTAGG